MKKFAALNISVKLSIIVVILLMLLPTLKSAGGQKNNKIDEQTFILACPKNTFPNVDLNDATAAVKVWGSELQKQLKMGVTFDLQIFENAEDITKYPKRDDLGLIITNTIDYFKLKSKMNLYPVVIPYDNHNVYKNFLILVKRDQYKTLKDVKDKKLGLQKIFLNPIPSMWLDVLLWKNKMNSKEKFFSSIKEYDSESQLILSVFFGQNDICVASKVAYETMVELNPQVEKQLAILYTSPGYLTGISSFSKNSRKFSYSERLIVAAMDLGNYVAGKQILTLMKTEKLAKFKPEYLNTIQELLKDYNALSKKKK